MFLQAAPEPWRAAQLFSTDIDREIVASLGKAAGTENQSLGELATVLRPFMRSHIGPIRQCAPCFDQLKNSTEGTTISTHKRSSNPKP